METVEAGWNLLINPLTEQDFSERITAFEPPARYENIFGMNVTEKMVGIIDEIESPERISEAVSIFRSDEK